MPVSYPYTFTYSEKAQNFFKTNHIFLGHHNRIEGVWRLGETVKIPSQVLVEPFGTLPAREWLNIGAFSYCRSKLHPTTRIGRYCSISWSCQVMGMAHPTEFITTHLMGARKYWNHAMREMRGGAPKTPKWDADGSPLIIGNDVWIGQNAIIKPGITIGNGAVVAAAAVVTKDVPPYAIVGGVPAKVLRYRLPAEIRARAQEIGWWRYPPEAFRDLPVDQPEAFLNGLERLIADGLQPYEPGQIDIAEALDQWLSQ